MSKFKNVKPYKLTKSKSKKEKWNVENDIEFDLQYRLLKMLAISVFEWKNLPLSIDKLYFERVLFERGKIAIFEDNVLGIVSLPIAPTYDLNIYGIPNERIAYSNNGYRKNITNENSVIIYDNVLKYSMEDIIFSYAKRLATVERIIDVNLNHTRHPYVISTTERQKELIEQIFKDIGENKPAIVVDEEVQMNIMKKSEVLNLNAPFVVDKLMDYKNTLRNEVLTIIGIGNSTQDKRERLLSSEMDNVNDQNKAYATIRYRSRLQALEELKEMFPELKDAEVCFSTDIHELVDEEFGGEEYEYENNNTSKDS